MKAAERVVGPLLSRWPDLPDDPATYVRLNGAAQFVAGAVLAIGKLRRLHAVLEERRNSRRTHGPGGETVWTLTRFTLRSSLWKES